MAIIARGQVARVSGTVTDSTGLPIARVQLTFSPNGAETFTDSAGQFALPPLRVGAYRLIIRRIGFDPMYGDATVQRAGEVSLSIVMRRSSVDPVRLDAMTINATAPASPELAGFYERRAQGIGEFIGPEQLEQRAGSPMSNILRSFATGSST